MKSSLLAGCLLTITVFGQQSLMEKVDAEAVKLWVTESFAQAMQANGTNPEKLVRRGLVADRQARRVEIQALATGIAQEPCEFFLVATFGRDYESLAVSMAKPSDIHDALVFIGVQPGYPINYPKLLYWPKGERVLMTYQWEENVDGKQVTRTLRAEDAITNIQKEKTLPRTGLMFTGSRQVVTADADKAEYGANMGGEIASDYNDTWTVLDVPYRASQGDIYGQLVPTEAQTWTMGQRLTVVLEPALPVGETSVREVAVTVSGNGNGQAASPADLRFTLELAGNVVVDAGDFDAFLGFIKQERAAQHDVYMAFAFAPELTVQPLLEFVAMIDALASRDVIRLEPREGELYYQAFLPQPRWRDREDRIVQPLEVHLTADGSGRMVVVDETYVNGEPVLKTTEEAFSDTEALLKLVAKRPEWHTDTWFLFAAAGVTYGDALELNARLRDQFPVVYVFAPQPAPPGKPAPAAP